MVSLEDLKNTVKEHLKKELKIMEMILSLNENDAQEFKDWYINQPLAKGIVEVYGLVDRRRIPDTNLSSDANDLLGQRD
jgi:hypothetical protein